MIILELVGTEAISGINSFYENDITQMKKQITAIFTQ